MIIGGAVALIVCIFAFVLGMEKGKIDATGELNEKHSLYVRKTNAELLEHIVKYEATACLHQLLIDSNATNDFWKEAVKKLSANEHSLWYEINQVATNKCFFASDRISYAEFKNFAEFEVFPRVILCVSNLQMNNPAFSRTELISIIQRIATTKYRAHLSIDSWCDLVCQDLYSD